MSTTADLPDLNVWLALTWPDHIHHQHAVFDDVEERFQQRPLASEPLDHCLQTFGIQPSDAAQNLVEKIGFRRRHMGYP